MFPKDYDESQKFSEKYLDKDKGWESSLARSVWHVLVVVVEGGVRGQGKGQEKKTKGCYMGIKCIDFEVHLAHLYLFSICHSIGKGKH